MQNEPSLQDIEDMATGLGGYVDCEFAVQGPAKSRTTYILLGLFVCGLFGVHNFYAGRTGRGIAQLIITVALGWLLIGIIITGFWVLMDALCVETDGQGRRFR